MQHRPLAAALALFVAAASAAGSDPPDVRVDLSFGLNGRAHVPTAPALLASRVTSDAQGRLVVTAGSSWYWHLTADGAPDSSAGPGGLVTRPYAVPVLDSAGRRLVSGGVTPEPNRHYFTLSRYLANGSLDTSFGTAGRYGPAPPAGWDVDGLIAFAALPGDSVLLLRAPDGGATWFALARLTKLTAAGQVDTSYGTGGSVDVGWGAEIYRGLRSGPVIFGPEGDAFVPVTDSSHPAAVLLRHFTASGSLDTSFGTGGDAVLPFGTGYGQVIDVERDGQGRFFAAGVEPSTPDHAADSLRLVRLLADGTADPSFGGEDGVIRVGAGSVDSVTYSAYAAGGADGSTFVVAGKATRQGGSPRSFLVALRTDSPSSQTLIEADPLFGGETVEVTGLAAQPDGRVVVTAIDWAADGKTAQDSFVARLRFDGIDGGTPVVVPSPAHGPVVLPSWEHVSRVRTRRGAATDKVDAVLHVENAGDSLAPPESLRVLLSADGVPSRRDRRVKTVDVPSLVSGASRDFALRLRIPRGAKGRRLIVVLADDPSKALAVSDPLP